MIGHLIGSALRGFFRIALVTRFHRPWRRREPARGVPGKKRLAAEHT